MKLRITFGARALLGANDGLDAQTCALRYAHALRAALSTEWPDAVLDVCWTETRASTRAEASDWPTEADARAVERLALDLAWVIRQMEPWA